MKVYSIKRRAKNNHKTCLLIFLWNKLTLNYFIDIMPLCQLASENRVSTLFIQNLNILSTFAVLRIEVPEKQKIYKTLCRQVLFMWENETTLDTIERTIS